MRIIALLVAVFILVSSTIVFALNNRQLVSVDLIVQSVELPLSNIVLFSILCGMLIGISVSFLIYLRLRWQLMLLRNKNKQLDSRLSSQMMPKNSG